MTAGAQSVLCHVLPVATEASLRQLYCRPLAPRCRCWSALPPPEGAAGAAAMAVLLQTSQGDLVVDLYTDLAPNACKNFLKLCKCVLLRCRAPVCLRRSGGEGSH